MNYIDHNIRNSTIGGTLLGIAPVISSGEVLKTVVLTAIGATVSFTLSLLLKYLWMKRKR